MHMAVQSNFLFELALALSRVPPHERSWSGTRGEA